MPHPRPYNSCALRTHLLACQESLVLNKQDKRAERLIDVDSGLAVTRGWGEVDGVKGVSYVVTGRSPMMGGERTM